MNFSKNASFALLKENLWSGADRVRTDDIQLAKLALSQLSYSPGKSFVSSLDAGTRHHMASPVRGSGGPRWT